MDIGELPETEEIYEDIYAKLSPQELNRRLSTARRGLHHFADAWVRPHMKVSEDLRNEYNSLLVESTDERPLQRFLSENPHLLTKCIKPGHHGALCIPQPRLGSEYIPDFIIGGFDSAGVWWYLIELESPRKSMFNRNGDPSAALTHALRQVDDWRAWLMKNSAYAREELGYRDIDGDVAAIVLMGTRSIESVPDNYLGRNRALVGNRQRLILHHYEWLSEFWD